MNIVLLQGPLGPFYQTLSRQLSAAGHRVVKVHFNGGDACWPCAGENLHYRGVAAGWNAYFRRLLKQYAVDAVLCYGDCRDYHRLAGQVCQRKQVPFWVLEEGYLRPDFVTLEQGGVNAFSPLYPQRVKLAQWQWPDAPPVPASIGKTFAARAWFASRYHINKALARRRYPHFVDHRPWTLWQEARGWLRGGWVKYRRRAPDRALLAHLQRLSGRIFLVPLQVSDDFQVRQHADLAGMGELIEQVMRSFAAHATAGQQGDVLLFKHHPMDRGYVCYRRQIERLSAELGLAGRVFYGHELPLPALYPQLKGVVTLNSTVGLSALLHQVPTFCLGRALYDIPGLTSQGTLAAFWPTPQPVCEATFAKVRQSLLHLTQLNGSFYRQLDASARAVMITITQANQVNQREETSSRPPMRATHCAVR